MTRKEMYNRRNRSVNVGNTLGARLREHFSELDQLPHTIPAVVNFLKTTCMTPENSEYTNQVIDKIKMQDYNAAMRYLGNIYLCGDGISMKYHGLK